MSSVLARRLRAQLAEGVNQTVLLAMGLFHNRQHRGPFLGWYRLRVIIHAAKQGNSRIGQDSQASPVCLYIGYG